jgi:hypothetical protein
MTATALSPLRLAPVRQSCALCPARAETPLGLCIGCLRAAADELARLAPALPSQADRSPASIPFRALCGRCGRPGHTREECDA